MKRFVKNDSGFVCANCGRTVEPLGYSSRDHCPFCLYSLHVDVLPGDRANHCGALLRPVSASPDAKKGFVIEYVCTKCAARLRCRAALSGAQPDDVDLIIALTAKQG
ncbi:MAG: RNHCP domain-containing protein [Clostridia bacterium]|nr:RNHCP domain-containing protein [Clostridia bacterium]